MWLDGGGQEGNPLILWLVQFTPSVKWGMIFVKLWTIGIGWWLWRKHARNLLIIINNIFLLVVGWNMFWLLFRQYYRL